MYETFNFIKDEFSKYYKAYKLNSLASTEITNALIKFFAHCVCTKQFFH